jgi:pyruvate kinase
MINSRKAKIVAKIADNNSEPAFLQSLFDAGADVAWLNTAHQDEEGSLEVMRRIRATSTRIPIMIDTKGPEVRTKNVETPHEVKAGDHIILSGDLSYTGPGIIHVTYDNFHNEVPVGESILYDDASIEMVVVEKVDRGIKCEIKSKGLLKSKKSLNVPNVHISLPALSKKDKGFIHFCAKNNIDYIIHSFVRNKQDLFEIKDILKQYPDYHGRIISKIENREGFNNVREILEHSDGLMVARGDLGAEVHLEEVPFMQKKMVEAALEMGKYSIVATQALESMIKNPRPTRAEVTDVANAILDGSGAMSMSGETAYGDYPLEATNMMGRIMKHTESKLSELVHYVVAPKMDDPTYVAAREILAEARTAGAKIVVLLSKDMKLVRALSALRPDPIIVPICTEDEDAREFMLAYAVRPLVLPTLDINSVISAIGSSSLADQRMLVVEQIGKNHEIKVADKVVAKV